MLCGPVDRMRRAEARLLEHPGVVAVGHTGSTQETGAPPKLRFGGLELPQSSEASQPKPILTLHRTEYPARDLSILDILPAGCSKGAALLALAASRGIDASEILAIGDNWNDVSMLEIAGSTVVMDNAPEDLKELARERGWRIGPSNLNDGVAEAIESALPLAAEI
jgi:hypothetical protein